MATTTTISVRKEDLNISIDLVEDEDLEKFVTCKDLVLAAFKVIGYFYSQKQLVEAYYKLDPDILDEREPGDPVLKLMPKYMK